MSGRVRRGARLLLLACLLPTATGCAGLGEALLGPDSATGPQTATVDERRCAELVKAPTGVPDVNGVTVLLADGSATSYTRKEPRKQQDWAKPLLERLPDSPRIAVVAGVFGGTVDWKLEKTTPGDSKNAARTREDREDTRACLSQELGEKLHAGAQRPQTDVLRAVSTAAQQIGKYGKLPKTIVVATDGLSNTGCADLRAADIGDRTVIPAIVRDCADELPRLDESYTVRFIGIGSPADGWPDVKTPHRVWLLDLWSRMCRATGANCPEPTAETPQTADAATAPPAKDAEVSMPGITVKPGNPLVITMPASILFDLDSARLTARAQEAMGSVIEQLDRLRYRRIAVAGHTDSTGSPAYNRRLSAQRAEAVRQALRARGITEVTATGYGSRKPACSPEYKGGIPDRVAMACNRRVEIIVYT
ncbi:hypothetical protein Sme01_46070 [Sphaerisporangium melleum]|uniref:OmpA-like domain-containing protein n=1 Tax=Sphaerisporangium melleum TaxID=321316 RepID=A0A917R0K9_9ACTN|nr:OmpA family protein [Sphaerisporangium melleum]GGK79771.1 hypothetical protein GCM10007964_23010 [Sphaerisporangium melleum]GII72131.1 hypothetical protein Sme01_46070 [Sphaerisporangium melleum]